MCRQREPLQLACMLNTVAFSNGSRVVLADFEITIEPSKHMQAQLTPSSWKQAESACPLKLEMSTAENVLVDMNVAENS